MTLSIHIPGEPCAQGRPRAFKTKSGLVRTYDPAKSRSWKGAAQVHYEEALKAAGLSAPAFPDGPLEVCIVAVFTCPKSAHHRVPVPRRPYVVQRNDWDNIGKAACDAGNGLLWADDGQIVRATVERFYGAQGEAPRVEISVTSLAPAPAPSLFHQDAGTAAEAR